MDRQIVVPSIVWQELQPWLKNPFRNAYIRDRLLDARISRLGNIRFDPEQDWSENQRIGSLYYSDLLAVRKRLGRFLAKDFAAQHGREPNSDEYDRLVQTTVAEHEFHLVRKGRTDIEKSTFFADEQLVVAAAVDAIVNRREATILTTDTDVLAQFVKLMNLLDWQFQAMLFAERYAAAPDSFETRPLMRATAELRHYFSDDTGLLIPKPCEPDEFFDWVVPDDQLITPVYCLLFGGNGSDLKFAPLDFTAVHDLARLLETKGKTCGQNTDLLNGKNCHVVGFPKGIDNPRSWVVIANDNVEVVDFMNYPLLDIAHANCERR